MQPAIIARMHEKDKIFLGFDPGGGDRFGVAALTGDRVESGTVSSVNAAIGWARSRCISSIPYAAGVDTLLHWADGPGGWRPADKALRVAYSNAARSVISPNGLYGSMAIGGMALAIRLREQWHDILLNETHPKLMVHVLGGDRYIDANVQSATAWLANHARIDTSRINNGHELDALLSAWATREGIKVGWCNLLEDHSSSIFPAGKVTYLWPDQLHMVSASLVRLQGSESARAGPSRNNRGTTEIGYINKNRQMVVRKTEFPGSDHRQRVYVVRCLACDHEYGVNGSDIGARRCPKHDGGAPGLDFSGGPNLNEPN